MHYKNRRYLYNAAELFKDTGHTGRCFTILRHPVERAVALYFTLKRNGKLSDPHMTLEQYAASDLSENNWMTRMLTNDMNGVLTPKHFEVAKEVRVDEIYIYICF